VEDAIVPDRVMLDVLSVDERPEDEELAVRTMVPVNPSRPETLIVAVALSPARIVSEAGLTLTVKSVNRNLIVIG
jgi:hypothetical protein